MPVMPPDPDSAAAMNEPDVPDLTGGGEAGGTGSQSLNEIVEQIDAEQAEELAAAADDDDDEGEGEGTPAKRIKPAIVPPALQKFVDEQYGGDWQAWVNGQFEQRNSIAALNKRIEELSQQTPEKRAEQLEELKQSDEDYQALNQEHTDLIAEGQQIEEEQGRLVARAIKMDREIASLEGEMRRADDDEKQSLKAEIEAKQAVRDSLNAQHQKNERDKSRVSRMLNSTKREISRREAAIREELDGAEEQEAENREFLEDTKQWFRGSFAEEAKAIGLQPGTPRYDKLYRAVKGELIQAMSRKEIKDRPPLTENGINSAVKRFFKETSDAFGLGAARRAVSLAPPRRPTEMRPVTSRALNARPKQSSADSESDINAVKARARRIFSVGFGGKG